MLAVSSPMPVILCAAEQWTITCHSHSLPLEAQHLDLGTAVSVHSSVLCLHHVSRPTASNPLSGWCENVARFQSLSAAVRRYL